MCVIIFQNVDSLQKRYQTPRDIKMKYRSLTENYGLDIAKARRYYVRFISVWTSLKYPLLQFVDTWYANAKYCSPQLKFHIDMTVNWYCCHFPHGADRSILKLGLSFGLFLFNNTKIQQFLLFPYAEFFSLVTSPILFPSIDFCIISLTSQYCYATVSVVGYVRCCSFTKNIFLKSFSNNFYLMLRITIISKCRKLENTFVLSVGVCVNFQHKYCSQLLSRQTQAEQRSRCNISLKKIILLGIMYWKNVLLMLREINSKHNK